MKFNHRIENELAINAGAPREQYGLYDPMNNVFYVISEDSFNGDDQIKKLLLEFLSLQQLNGNQYINSTTK